MLQWTMGYVYLFKFLFPWSICLGVGLLGHRVALFLGFCFVLFLRNFHTVFHSGCINLHSHQQYKSIPFSSRHLQRLLFVGFLIMVILIGVRWYIIVLLICVSLIIINVEHPFVCLLAICMSSFEKCLFRYFSHFFTGLLFWYWVVWAACKVWKLTFC